MRHVPVRCPCCGGSTLTAIMWYDSTEGSQPGWTMDDFEADCDCADYMEHMPRTLDPTRGTYWNHAPDRYRDKVEERALEEMR